MTRIPGEMPCADSSIDVERALKKLREKPYHDGRMQGIAENWIRKAPGVSRDQSRIIGVLWMTKILEVDKGTAREFALHNFWAEEIAQDPQGHLPESRLSAFWTGIAEIIPELVKKEDLDYLIKTDHYGKRAWKMITLIDEVKPVKGFLTTHLVANHTMYEHNRDLHLPKII